MPNTSSRTTYRLGFDCNNACVFCGQLDRSGSQAIDRAELQRLRRDHNALSIIGGEPSLDPRLLELVELARELGFSDIGLQTNAQFMAEDPKLLERLVRAGLSDLHLSIHAPDAAGHDYLTGTAGSFANCMAALDEATRQGVSTVVTSVITRSNFRELLNMPGLLKPRGVAAWLIDLVRPYGNAAEGFARVMPRIGMALPWALHALESSRRHALLAWIRGAPTCSLGPFAAFAIHDAPRSYVEACEGCPARSGCPGVDDAYLEVFGRRELRPVSPKKAAASDARRRHLMEMFVGPGELVEHPIRLFSEGFRSEGIQTDAGKHRLPVLANTSAPEPDSGSTPS